MITYSWFRFLILIFIFILGLARLSKKVICEASLS